MTYFLLLCIISTFFGNTALFTEKVLEGSEAQIPAALCSSQNCDGRFPSEAQCLGAKVPGNVYHFDYDTLPPPVQIKFLGQSWKFNQPNRVVFGNVSLFYSETCHAFFTTLTNRSQQPLQGTVCISRLYTSLPGAYVQAFCTPTAPSNVGEDENYTDLPLQQIAPGETLIFPLAGVDALSAQFRAIAVLEDPYDHLMTHRSADAVTK